MSLIDQALKRAQAAQQDAGASLPARPWAPTPLPDRQRARGRRLRQVLFGAVVLGVLAAGVFRLVGRTPGKTPGGAKRSSAVTGPLAGPTGGLASPPAKAAVSPTGPLPEIFVPPPARAPAVPREKPQRPSRTRDRSPALTLEAPDASNPPGSGLRPPTQDRTTTSREDRIFIGEFSTPSAGKIELGGIVYSETHPVALINGRVVEIGAVIEGFTVAEIQPDRVKLEAEHETIWIRLK